MTTNTGEPVAIAAGSDEAAKPKHTRQAERFRTVPLEWPIEFSGVTYDKITVSRMTTAQVAEFMLSVERDGSYANLPMYDVPRAVMDALDADDAEKVNDAVLDFLPRRFRDTERSPPDAGANTSASPPPASADKASSG